MEAAQREYAVLYKHHNIEYREYEPTRVDGRLLRARLIAVITYAGSQSEGRLVRNRQRLLKTVRADHVRQLGDPVILFSEDGLRLPFSAKNEIGVEVESLPAAAGLFGVDLVRL